MFGKNQCLELKKMKKISSHNCFGRKKQKTWNKFGNSVPLWAFVSHLNQMYRCNSCEGFGSLTCYVGILFAKCHSNFLPGCNIVRLNSSFSNLDIK